MRKLAMGIYILRKGRTRVTTLKKQILRIAFWPWDVLRVTTQSKTVEYCVSWFLFSRYWWGEPDKVDNEKMFW